MGHYAIIIIKSLSHWLRLPSNHQFQQQLNISLTCMGIWYHCKMGGINPVHNLSYCNLQGCMDNSHLYHLNLDNRGNLPQMVSRLLLSHIAWQDRATHQILRNRHQENVWGQGQLSNRSQTLILLIILLMGYLLFSRHLQYFRSLKIPNMYRQSPDL